jgi:hypothetical protein
MQKKDGAKHLRKALSVVLICGERANAKKTLSYVRSVWSSIEGLDKLAKLLPSRLPLWAPGSLQALAGLRNLAFCGIQLVEATEYRDIFKVRLDIKQLLESAGSNPEDAQRVEQFFKNTFKVSFAAAAYLLRCYPLLPPSAMPQVARSICNTSQQLLVLFGQAEITQRLSTLLQDATSHCVLSTRCGQAWPYPSDANNHNHRPAEPTRGALAEVQQVIPPGEGLPGVAQPGKSVRPTGSDDAVFAYFMLCSCTAFLLKLLSTGAIAAAEATAGAAQRL